jgi:uncharacterized protein
MNVYDIILEHYGPDTPGAAAHEILINHSRQVAEKAVEIARNLGYNDEIITFVREGALMHDIGIFLTNAKGLGCFGKMPYIMHGVLGKELLETKGLHRHARVCETHVGVGFTKSEIVSTGLPLPLRDMLPESFEEKIICVADKFFRKIEGSGQIELGLDQTRQIIAGYGSTQANRFDQWLDELGVTG